VRTLTRRLSGLSEAERQLENLRHVAIRTFDSWAFRLLRLAGEMPQTLLSRSHDANIEEAVRLIAGSRRDEVRSIIGDRRHIFVDEFQDLTGCRARLVAALLELLAPLDYRDCGFTLLGDPAQAIYRFANRDNSDDTSGTTVWDDIGRLYGTSVETIPLHRNHRSSEAISDFGRGLRSILESGLPADDKLERVRRAIRGLPAPEGELGPDWTARPHATSAILARTNSDAIRIMQKLLGTSTGGARAKLILRAGNWTPVAPAWIAVLLSRLRAESLPKSQFDRICAKVGEELDDAQRAALSMPSCDDAWLRLLHAAGKAGEEQSLQISGLRERLDWPDSFPDDEQQPEDGLYVTTVHQSKGMEFDEVHLLEARIDDRAGDNPLEEASVGFVGVTRAARRLARIPADAIYYPLKRCRKCPDRLYSWNWKKGWINLEMGIGGDVAPTSFVDTGVHSDENAVAEVQKFLLDGAPTLPGRKVLLVKVSTGSGTSKAFYDIHLQEENGEPGLRLGRTSSQLTRALLNLVWDKGYSLPSRIMNLRVGALGTMTAGDEVQASIPEPWSTSRLWLGVSLVGTGDFRPFKRNGR
jgi:hypothetical protein